MSQLSEIPASAYTLEMETLGAVPDIPTFDDEPVPVSRNLLPPGPRPLQLLPSPGPEVPVRYETSRMRGFQSELFLTPWDCEAWRTYPGREVAELHTRSRLLMRGYWADRYFLGERVFDTPEDLEVEYRGFSVNDFLSVSDFPSYFASRMQARLPEILEYTQAPPPVQLDPEHTIHVPAQRYQEICQRFGFARSYIGRLYSDVHERDLEIGRLRRHQSRQSSAVSRLQAEVERLRTKLEVEGIPLDSSEEDEDDSSSDDAPPSPPPAAAAGPSHPRYDLAEIAALCPVYLPDGINTDQGLPLEPFLNKIQACCFLLLNVYVMKNRQPGIGDFRLLTVVCDMQLYHRTVFMMIMGETMCWVRDIALHITDFNVHHHGCPLLLQTWALDKLSLIPSVPARLISTYGAAIFQSRTQRRFDFGDNPIVRWTCPWWRIRLVTTGSMNLNYVLYASLDGSMAYFPDRISSQYGMIQRVPKVHSFESGLITSHLLTNLADRWRNRNTRYLGEGVMQDTVTPEYVNWFFTP
ncbi:hypothetical protein JCGZ_03156 [Jatropha curcas]|uniref:Aminotransferase-like plant mobile domain-containing protein n=1 Tax=Jatropha curcas TaxID=180498 RepID=A0A067L968_JATCU|nr:hypothetical protein JCGZ_03156 [Jatropha curcas]